MHLPSNLPGPKKVHFLQLQIIWPVKQQESLANANVKRATAVHV